MIEPLNILQKYYLILGKFVLHSMKTHRNCKQMGMKLLGVKEKLTLLIQQASYEQIHRSCRQICVQLQYFYNFVRCYQLATLNQLSQCIIIINTLIAADQPHKYGHALLPLAHLLNHHPPQYSTPQLHLHKLMARLDANHKSKIYQSNHYAQISTNQRKCLKSEGFNKLLSELAGQELVLQNPQCVWCSRVFMEGFIILNTNPRFKILIGLSFADLLDLANIQRYFNAVINDSGGVIIFGVKKVSGVLITEGINFNTNQEVKEKQQQLKSLLQKIKPPCHYKIQPVLVHSNFTESENIGAQNMRFCFKILVMPFYSKKMHYVEAPSKYKDKIWEMYQLNIEEKPQKIVSLSSQNKVTTLYKIMHQNYYKSAKDVSSHENISCCQPYPFYSKKFTDSINSGYLNLNQTAKPKMKLAGTLKFKYHNTCLLVVTSPKNDRYVDRFYEYLVERKQSVELCQPFEKIFHSNQGVRSVWMLSYEISLTELKKLLKILQQKGEKGGVKLGSVKIMPVEKGIQIQKSKLSHYNQQILQKKFMEMFDTVYKIQEIQMEEKDGQPVPLWQLIFNDLEEAIFAYMVLEELHIWAYFAKQGAVYQKKPK